MGGGKETPRQKMVGLMYLVLMAMLAMNVSKEIINTLLRLTISWNQVNKQKQLTQSYQALVCIQLQSPRSTPSELARVEMHKTPTILS